MGVELTNEEYLIALRDHQRNVKRLIGEMVLELVFRGMTHDASKNKDPEKSMFQTLPLALKDLEYGSDEYRAAMQTVKPAIEHHYTLNRHHPEHFEDSISGMNLLDIMEMLCDWKAAGKRNTKPIGIRESIEINAKRFKMDPQLKQVLLNTVDLFGEEE